MVCLYTRINDLNDVIMRDVNGRFEVEARSRKNILSQFLPTRREVFTQEDSNAERSAEREYDCFLFSALKQDDK